MLSIEILYRYVIICIIYLYAFYERRGCPHSSRRLRLSVFVARANRKFDGGSNNTIIRLLLLDAALKGTHLTKKS